MSEIADVVELELITDEWGNAIRDRTVQRYADVAERTTEHAAPTAGDLSYLADSGDVDVYHAGAWRHLGTPVGAIQMLGGGATPAGWLLCNGAAVSRTTYAALFAQIGTAHGAGDGTTTFNVPDMRGRYPRGVAASGTGDAVGETFGNDAIVDHTHPVDPPSQVFTSGNASSAIGSFNATGVDHVLAKSPHTHDTTVNIPSFDSGAVTGTNPEDLPASRALLFVIKT